MGSDGFGLSGPEQRFLRDHGGPPYLPGEERGLLQQHADVAEAEEQAGRAASLTAEEAASRLGVTVQQVRDRIRDRSLVDRAFGAERRLPSWQVLDSGVIPHLREVLHALPVDAHPLTVEGFMTTPSDELDGATPAHWLATGRGVDRVLQCAAALTVW